MKKTIVLMSTLLLSASLAAQEEFFSESGEFTADSSGQRHVIPVEAGTTIEVVVIGENVDTTLEATLPDGSVIENDDYEDFNAGFSRTINSDGEIILIAAPLSSGTTGGYRVVARALPAPTKIEVGQAVEGNLTGSGDRYELSGEAGTRVAIDLKSYDFDAYLTLVDSAGNESTDDDGGAEGYNSRLHYQFDSDETVTITASALSSESGRYELVVSELSNEAALRHTGQLTGDSPRGYDGTTYARHEIEGQAGETLTVELNSDAFDPVLFIANPDGTNLIRDDDGGNDNNSLAVATLPEDGTYVIYVTSFGEGLGSYELIVYR